jgi:2,5-diamino-6-(ribosylamino)-4(3H)-pyrimidinone 5'-phosphate reductase
VDLASIMEQPEPPVLPSSQNTLSFSSNSAAFLQSYLPSASSASTEKLPFVTLTYASSLDSAISLSPGIQTILSGPESKAMTHYLRSQHSAILIGANTAIADDPGLNCRIDGVGGYGGADLLGQPRPVVVDPHGRWLQTLTKETRVLRTALEGKGRAPIIFTNNNTTIPAAKLALLKEYGGMHVFIGPEDLDQAEGVPTAWEGILKCLASKGLKSVMIEGGGAVINSLLSKRFAPVVNSVIVTIAPVYLGKGGVIVSPDRDDKGKPTARLKDVRWQGLGEDVVMCGRLSP